MCGVAGLLVSRGDAVTEEELTAIGNAIRHRGPDASGTFIEAFDGGEVGLVHRRLSIIDLEGGVQPMRRRPGGPVLVYNGELYNYQELREALIARGAQFETSSDTEVVLAAYEQYGADFLRHLSGMFALAIYEPSDHTLLLARDRLGQKPLNYVSGPGFFAFASELSALEASPRVTLTPDPAAVRDLLAYQFIAGARSFYREVKRVEPGQLVRVALGRAPEAEAYWALTPGETGHGSIEEAVDQLRSRFDRIVDEHMVSDVPVGAFLSGGLDSSYVVAAMVRADRAPVETFTVRFETDDPRYDEAEWAEKVSRHLGTRHHEVVVGDDLLLKTVAEVAEQMDEPLADPALVPTFLLSKFARERVKVVLTGEGADELFAGYPRYRLHSLRRFALGPPVRSYKPTFVFRDGELERLLAADCRRELAEIPPPRFFRRWDGDFVNSLLFSEITSSLPDNLLMKVDKMSMLASLEARVPFLDHGLVEWAMTLPGAWKMRGGTLKDLLKRAALRDLPEEIITRKKHGFTLPVKEWLTRPGMQRAVRELLSESELVRLGFLDRAALAGFIDRGLGKPRHARKIWTLYGLELWLQHRASRAKLSSPAVAPESNGLV